jgi:hypothetical protein
MARSARERFLRLEKAHDPLVPGSVLGKLTLTERKGHTWACTCACGAHVERAYRSLLHPKRGDDLMCSACRPGVTMQGPEAFLAGTRVGELTVLGPLLTRDPSGRVRWLCLCACGADVVRTSSTLLHARSLKSAPSSEGSWPACETCWRQATKIARLHRELRAHWRAGEGLYTWSQGQRLEALVRDELEADGGYAFDEESYDLSDAQPDHIAPSKHVGDAANDHATWVAESRRRRSLRAEQRAKREADAQAAAAQVELARRWPGAETILAASFPRGTYVPEQVYESVERRRKQNLAALGRRAAVEPYVRRLLGPIDLRDPARVLAFGDRTMLDVVRAAYRGAGERPRVFGSPDLTLATLADRLRALEGSAETATLLVSIGGGYTWDNPRDAQAVRAADERARARFSRVVWVVLPAAARGTWRAILTSAREWISLHAVGDGAIERALRDP